MTAESAFRAYSGYVATVALRILGRNDDLDDVVQEVFLEAVRGLSELRDQGAVRGWLATVTVRISSQKLRRRRLRSFFGLDSAPEYGEVVAPGASPEDRALLGRIYAVLDGMSVSLRVPWTLRYVEGESLDAIAGICGCSLATVKRRITAAHEELEKVVSDG